MEWWKKIFLMMILSVSANGAFAAGLVLDHMSDGYKGCSWRDNGDGTSTLNLTIYYKEVAGHTGGYSFNSRAVMFYTYNFKGQMQSSSLAAKSVSMNGASYGEYWSGNFTLYNGGRGGADVNPKWKVTTPYTADVEIVIDNKTVKDWPAVSVRAANFTSVDDVAEINGGAYIARDGEHGSCKTVDPEKPPPPPIVISMTAPDWNLGELPEGEGKKTLSGIENQLCFTYSGSNVSDLQFVIKASNANGIAGNRYRLKSVDDASQLVPYSMTLNSGVSSLFLPNSDGTALSLSSSGRTCFVPTFKTSVGAGLKEGTYNDVLIFTVTTKS
ncbi:hypothetical protein [Burkholderia sp. BCC0397]|uniref:hypothetical protein n=1 Tax=Burkholderia sp. BCC0397 TaxID=486876 RepID=UPI00158B6E3A|nr:hypothetical protein [Burkholderia sp. BCC0397]